MEKKYELIEVFDEESGYILDDIEVEDGVQPVYFVDTKFKNYLFETALAQELTNLKDKPDFDRNVEMYKILEEAKYLGYDNVSIEISGIMYNFNRYEIVQLCEIMGGSIMEIDELLSEVRKRLETGKKEPKIVVYTCITGGYDDLKKLSNVTPGVDYICFTDNKDLKSDIWKIRPIPEELLTYSKVKQQRGVKILQHRYLPEYDISIWVDANMDVKGNLNDYLKNFDFNKYSVFIPEHPARKCIYKEKTACVSLKKITGDGIKLADKQMARYKAEKFPENDGLVQTNIVIRKHNTEYCKKLMELWWNELKDYSHRDQLSFNYALWKNGKEKFKYLGKTTCNSKTFKWSIRHKK